MSVRIAVIVGKVMVGCWIGVVGSSRSGRPPTERRGEVGIAVSLDGEAAEAEASSQLLSELLSRHNEEQMLKESR